MAPVTPSRTREKIKSSSPKPREKPEWVGGDWIRLVLAVLGRESGGGREKTKRAARRNPERNLYGVGVGERVGVEGGKRWREENETVE